VLGGGLGAGCPALASKPAEVFGHGVDVCLVDWGDLGRCVSVASAGLVGLVHPIRGTGPSPGGCRCRLGNIDLGPGRYSLPLKTTEVGLISRGASPHSPFSCRI
jgi:hypothetical protein